MDESFLIQYIINLKNEQHPLLNALEDVKKDASLKNKYLQEMGDLLSSWKGEILAEINEKYKGITVDDYRLLIEKTANSKLAKYYSEILKELVKNVENKFKLIGEKVRKICGKDYPTDKFNPDYKSLNENINNKCFDILKAIEEQLNLLGKYSNAFVSSQTYKPTTKKNKDLTLYTYLRTKQLLHDYEFNNLTNLTIWFDSLKKLDKPSLKFPVKIIIGSFLGIIVVLLLMLLVVYIIEKVNPSILPTWLPNL